MFQTKSEHKKTEPTNKEIKANYYYIDFQPYLFAFSSINKYTEKFSNFHLKRKVFSFRLFVEKITFVSVGSMYFFENEFC